MQGLQGSTKAPGCKAAWQSLAVCRFWSCPPAGRKRLPTNRTSHAVYTSITTRINYELTFHLTCHRTKNRAKRQCFWETRWVSSCWLQQEWTLHWSNLQEGGRQIVLTRLQEASTSSWNKQRRKFNAIECFWDCLISHDFKSATLQWDWSTINFCWSVLSGSPNIGDAGPVMSHDVPIQSRASPQHVGARHACQMSPVRLCYQTLNENCAWSFHLAQDCEDLIRPGHKDQLELEHLETSK